MKKILLFAFFIFGLPIASYALTCPTVNTLNQIIAKSSYFGVGSPFKTPSFSESWHERENVVIKKKGKSGKYLSRVNTIIEGKGNSVICVYHVINDDGIIDGSLIENDGGPYIYTKGQGGWDADGRCSYFGVSGKGCFFKKA